jgi:hypothetical protein
MVRCKFKIESIEQFANGVSTVKMSAVTGDSPENKSFWKWTPAGTIVLHTINQQAAASLKVGGEYFIDISEALAPVAAAT